MKSLRLSIFAVVLIQVYSEPQFITVKEGKLGVNFGGYHAAVGLGGLLGGGAGGGLFAEAGTPHGQAARAGLAGAVGADGRSAGGLYAGATAGGNIKAETGLAGGVAESKAAGTGFASAQAGNHNAAAGLGGAAEGVGTAGLTYVATKTVNVPPTVIKETVVPIGNIEHNIDTDNEIKGVPLSNSGFGANVGVNVEANAQPAVVVKEVSNWTPREVYYVPRFPNVNFQEIMGSLFRVSNQGRRPQIKWRAPISNFRVKQVYTEPHTKIIEKHIVRSKPHRHHLHKTAYIGGFIGADTGVAPSETVVYKNIQPVLEKRIDVGGQATANAGANIEAGAHANGGGEVTYTKEITVGRNPHFFEQIFNIPIATLNAVSNLLTNTASNISIQKTATVKAGADF